MSETLLLADAFSYIHNIPNKSVRLILTDPPYVISRETNFSKGGGNEGKYGKLTMDFGKWDDGSVDIIDLLPEFKRVLMPGGTAVIFYDVFKLGTLKDAAEKVGFKQPRVGVWRKTNPVPVNAKTNYLSNAREYFLSVTKPGKRVFNSYYDRAEYDYPIVHGKERVHPTQKPVGLMKEIILANSNEGDTVFDPFFGSGATGKAAAQTGRNFIGIEIEKDYFDKYNEQKTIS